MANILRESVAEALGILSTTSNRENFFHKEDDGRKIEMVKKVLINGLNMDDGQYPTERRKSTCEVCKGKQVPPIKKPQNNNLVKVEMDGRVDQQVGMTYVDPADVVHKLHIILEELTDGMMPQDDRTIRYAAYLIMKAYGCGVGRSVPDENH